VLRRWQAQRNEATDSGSSRLVHDAHVPPQAFELQRLDVYAVDEHLQRMMPLLVSLIMALQ